MNNSIFASALVLAFICIGCSDEGPIERAGRQVDETVEDVRENTEGGLERLGRQVDEAVKETDEAAKEIKEAADEIRK